MGHPLAIAVLANNLPTVELLVELGADPVYDEFGHRWISQNDYELARTEEMKDMLRRLAKLRISRPDYQERLEQHKFLYG